MKYGPSIAAIVVLASVASAPIPANAGEGSGGARPKAVAESQAPEPPAPTPAPSGEKPEETPAEKPADTPAAQPTEQPAEQPTVQPTVHPAAKSAVKPPPVMPGADLAKTIERLRKSPIGAESNAVAYLDRIAAGRATAAQVNDFAAYIAKRGMPKVALAFQEHALRLDATTATLWLNLGTIQRTNRSWDPAVESFKKAIAIDPANALAHYNLGAVYDAKKRYNDAIEEYRRALVLDPDLADPRKNPQVVNNDNLLAVKLQIYQDQAGSIGLPLLQMQKTPPRPKAAPDKP